MANFKVVVSDPKTRKSYQKEIDQNASGILGKKIGDKIPGNFFGLEGYELEITGGSDKDGFPMRPDVLGTGRKKVLLSFGPGFHPKRKGQRKKKLVRGNTVSPDIVQVNTKIVKYGSKPIEVSLGIKTKAEEEHKKEEQVAKREETEQQKAKAEKQEVKAESDSETKERGEVKEVTAGETGKEKSENQKEKPKEKPTSEEAEKK